MVSESRLAANKRWKIRNKEKVRKIARDYYQNNKIQFRQQVKEIKKKNRIDVIFHYSNGRMECKCCGEKLLDFLTVDHINGGGNTHRKIIGNGSISMWIKRNNYPKGFQILCMNCNHAKGKLGRCPHNDV